MVSRRIRAGGNLPTFAYGASSTVDTPVAGDWDGDGKTTVGVYRDQGANSNSRWMLRNDNSSGEPQLNFEWGAKNDLPVVGDWDGNGTDTVGIYRKNERKFYLTNSNQPGFDIMIPFDDVCGPSDVCTPVAGDWDGDGKTTVGLYLPATATWTLWNNSLAPKVTFAYGGTGDVPVVGDWDGDGVTTVGVVRTMGDGQLHWLLRNTPKGGEHRCPIRLRSRR